MKIGIKFGDGTDLPKNFYLNNQIKELFDKIENRNLHFLLAGKAGTGKSTFIEYLRINSKKDSMKLKKKLSRLSLSPDEPTKALENKQLKFEPSYEL